LNTSRNASSTSLFTFTPGCLFTGGFANRMSSFTTLFIYDTSPSSISSTSRRTV
jgi:hypothetical protein